MTESHLLDISRRSVSRKYDRHNVTRTDASEEPTVISTSKPGESTYCSTTWAGSQNQTTHRLSNQNLPLARYSPSPTMRRSNRTPYSLPQAQRYRWSWLLGTIYYPFLNENVVNHLTSVTVERLYQLWAVPYAFRLTVYISLLLALGCIQLLYGLLFFEGDSLSYAVRTLLDCSGLLVSLTAMMAPNWRPQKNIFPFGYARYQLMAAFINCLYTAYTALWTFVEGMHDFYDPQLTHH